MSSKFAFGVRGVGPSKSPALVMVVFGAGGLGCAFMKVTTATTPSTRARASRNTLRAIAEPPIADLSKRAAVWPRVEALPRAGATGKVIFPAARRYYPRRGRDDAMSARGNAGLAIKTAW